jgi:2-isopropylmalate synthase
VYLDHGTTSGRRDQTTKETPMFNARKYRPVEIPQFSERTWPDRTVRQPPIWCSVDLRDGNQALVEPMGRERKLTMFEKLVAVGFKEIEIGFPAASQTDFDFVRFLIEEDRIPADVTVQVLTQARQGLIRRTIESLRGARRAIVHLYNSTNPAQRTLVFGMSQRQVLDLAVQGTRFIQEAAATIPDTDVILEYSPESFSATELEFAVDVVDAVVEAWNPNSSRKMIVNLPATVEVSMPNVYADQIEWMSSHIARRDGVVLSVHTHNDRGCAVAAAELAMLAGAERVEGTLFGNGERTGNADVVTLALNLFAQGIAPGLDFSDLPSLVETFETCNQMPLPARHPYAGELVFTAFSGSHQDAIAKGLAARSQEQASVWQVPYLPIDPADVGRAYQPLIRINSQSGKSGVSFVLESTRGYRVPKALAVEFSRVVQAEADKTGKELLPAVIAELFERTYLGATRKMSLVDYEVVHPSAERAVVSATIRDAEVEVSVTGEGRGALEAFAHAMEAHLGQPLQVADYSEHALSAGSDAEAMAYVRLSVPSGAESWGVARDRDIVTASLRAVVAACEGVRGS